MAEENSPTDDYPERLAEWMEALPHRPEPPLSNDELRWFRRYRRDSGHRAWLRKQIFVWAPIITTTAVALYGAWKVIAPYISFPGGK